MANPLRGEASFQAGGKTWTLVFDVNAFCDLEADTGLSTNELVAQIQSNPSFTLLRDVFTAGVQNKHPGTSKRDVGEMMSEAGLEGITGAMQKAFAAAMPPAKPRGGRGANPPKAGK